MDFSACRMLPALAAAAAVIAGAWLTASAALPTTAPAAMPATQPATRPTDQLFVRSVSGNVRITLCNGQTAVPATVGMTVGDDAEIQTGLKGTIELTGPQGQTIKIKHLTRGVVHSVGGRLTFESRAQLGPATRPGEAVPYDVEIDTPRSTLQIKG